jgi:hypothetical protein
MSTLNVELLDWFEESDDEDDQSSWQATPISRDDDDGDTGTMMMPWFVLSAPEFWLEFQSRRAPFDCFPWWQAMSSSSSSNSDLRARTRKAMTRLHDEAKLALAFVALVRATANADVVNDNDDNDENGDGAVSLHVDTFAHKLARLKHLNQDDMRTLHRLRTALHLRHSDELALVPTMTPRPPGTPPAFGAEIRTRLADAVPPWLRAALLTLLPLLDAVSLARLGATCTALASATSHDKLWRRFAAPQRRAHESISYRRLYCTLANFALRRAQRRALALASLEALGAAPRDGAVHAVAMCGMKRLQKRRVLQLLRIARPGAVRAGECALHWTAERRRFDVLDVGHLQLFGGARGQRVSVVPVSAMIYVVDNFAPHFFSCKALVHLLYELARLRGTVAAVLIYCVMWHSAPKVALEADRVAQELFTPALVELRVEARVQAIDPRTGAGVGAGLEWLERALSR